MDYPQLPRLATGLRFAGGDLVIKLSKDTRLDLLLSKDFVADCCPGLEPALRHDQGDPCSWGLKNAKEITKPAEGKVRMFTLALKFTDRTLVLEGPTFRGVPKHEDCILFDDYPLPDNSYTRCPQPGWVAEPRAAAQFIIIMRLIHNMPFRLEDLLSSYDGTRRANDLNILLPHLSELCSRADHMGCLPQVAETITAMLLRHDRLWVAVSEAPDLWLAFAVKTRATEIYFDAFRHLMASDKSYHRDFLAEHLLMTSKDLSTALAPLLLEQSKTIHRLRKGLCELEMAQVLTDAVGGGKEPRQVPFDLKAKMFSQTNAQKRNQEAEEAARLRFREWVAHREAGSRLYISRGFKTKLRGVPQGPLNKGIQKLEEKVNAKKPLAIFPTGVITDIAQKHGLGQDLHSHIHYSLRKVVLDADAVVKEVFTTREITTDDGGILKYRRSRYDCGTDEDGEAVWTYLPVDESDVPWKEQEDWPTEYFTPLSLWPADEEELEAVGITDQIEVGEDSDGPDSSTGSWVSSTGTWDSSTSSEDNTIWW